MSSDSNIWLGPAKRLGNTFVAMARRAGACEWLGGTRPLGQLVKWILGAVPAVLRTKWLECPPADGDVHPDRYHGRPKRTQEL